MFLTLILTLSGLLLMGRVASGEEKKPLELLGALALIGLAVALNIASGEGLLVIAGRIALEIGIGLLLAAGLIARRKGPARPFFTLGALALVFAVMVFGGRRMLGIESPGMTQGQNLIQANPTTQHVSILEPVLSMFLSADSGIDLTQS